MTATDQPSGLLIKEVKSKRDLASYLTEWKYDGLSPAERLTHYFGGDGLGRAILFETVNCAASTPEAILAEFRLEQHRRAERRQGRTVNHMVISRRGHTDPQLLVAMARRLLDLARLDGQKAAIAVHTDTENTHLHIAVSALDKAGRQIILEKGHSQEDPTPLDDLTPAEADAARLAKRLFADEHDLKHTARILLQELGLPPAPGLIRDVILARLAGMIEAQDRSALITHPEMSSAFDAVAKLVDDKLVAGLRANAAGPSSPATEQAASQTDARKGMHDPASPHTPQNASNNVNGANPRFVNRDERRFSEVIDEIIKTKRESGEWSIDYGDQKRLLTVFAWLTDDKRLCEYTQADVNEFKAAYYATPSGFRWAKYLNSKPRPQWSEVKATIKGPVKRRSAKTFNRDVGVIHGACTVLAGTAWKPLEGEGPVLKIGKRSTVIETADELDLRAPWSETELRTLFRLPLYTGNGGHLKRLQSSDHPEVWQDAAYWLPLLAAYSGACRDELAGLEVVDIDVDCEVPYFYVRNNLARSKDGVTPGGQKAPSRRRHLPLHSELLKLGFSE